VVWLHGFGVSYDLPQCVRVGRELAARGISFVAGNLRGHDGAGTGWRYRGDSIRLVRTGGWYEVFEDSDMDVQAWITHAETLGAARLVLVGHSFGALHAVHHLSTSGDDRVDALVLASPSFGLRHLEAEVAAVAKKMVTAGQGQELLPEGSWQRGFGTRTVSAQTYVSWARVAPRLVSGPDTMFADIRCPLFVYYGTSDDIGGQAEVDFISERATSARSFEHSLLPGVTHGYIGAETTVASQISDWVDSLARASD
jgi:pimeloyl-ACP methyl ester carboxylesterase